MKYFLCDTSWDLEYILTFNAFLSGRTSFMVAQKIEVFLVSDYNIIPERK